MNETLETIDGRSALRIERRFAHPREKVWRALTQPQDLHQWFPFDVEMDPEADRKIRFIEEGGAGPATEGTITEFDPPRLLAYTWGDDLLRYELRPDDGGCLLVFTHSFDDRAGAASFATGWHGCLEVLAMVLDGRPAEWPGPRPELHEAYVAAFGLDKGSAELTTDGWRVRFERQLTRPVDDAWALLNAPAPAASTSDADAPVIGGPVPPSAATAQFPARTVTAVEVPALLEYDWQHEDRPGGRVRWELSAGTGHGARLTFTQTGPGAHADERFVALAAWRTHIAALAKQLENAQPH